MYTHKYIRFFGFMCLYTEAYAVHTPTVVADTDLVGVFKKCSVFPLSTCLCRAADAGDESTPALSTSPIQTLSGFLRSAPCSICQPAFADAAHAVAESTPALSTSPTPTLSGFLRGAPCSLCQLVFSDAADAGAESTPALSTSPKPTLSGFLRSAPCSLCQPVCTDQPTPVPDRHQHCQRRRRRPCQGF